MEQETFWSLLFNLPHWEFELFLMFLFDGVVGLILWPRVRKFFVHHQEDDDKIARLEHQVRILQIKLGMTDEELKCNIDVLRSDGFQQRVSGGV